MGDKRILEVFGTMTKEEKLYQIDSIVLNHTLVYEAKEPFPGYYHNDPTKPSPLYIYLIMKKNYGWEDILRASQKILKETDLEFESAKSYIIFDDNPYYAIRIRKLTDYSQILKLQKAFIKNNILFLDAKTKNHVHMASIKMVKIFNLCNLKDGVYFDEKEKRIGYFELPEYIKWKQFEEVVKNVRYNWDEAGFDAAMCSIYIDSSLREMIRIYSHGLNAKFLKSCKNKFMMQIQKPA